MAEIEADPAFGINIFGYLHAESGVGEHSRQLVEAVKQARIPYSAVPYTRTLTRQKHSFHDLGTGSPTFPITIGAVNADEFPFFVDDVGEDFLRSTYTIGLWAWEIETFPPSLATSQDFVDEIWANSRFSARAIRQQVQRPVLPFPLPVSVPRVSSQNRADLGLPEGTLFLFCFDFASVFERKNPIATVEAFLKAFPSGKDAYLVIKSTNGDRYPNKLAELRDAANGDPRISVIDEYWSAEKLHAVMASCDAYVSLHRSEGFGLTIAEAMAHGKPVIATDYSGNLDFMSEDNSYLVPASKVKIPPGCNPYPTGAFWAEPDVEAAALLMQELVLNTDKVAEKARRGQEDIERYHSPFARSSFIRSRIAEISRQLDEGVLRPLTTLPPRTQVEIRANAESPGVGFVRTVVQTEVEAIDQVVARLTEGPDLKNPARLGRPGLWLRQLVFRLLRNYHLYQYEVGHTLVQALRENRNHIDAIARRLDDLEKRVDAIAATPADLNVPDDRE